MRRVRLTHIQYANTHHRFSGPSGVALDATSHLSARRRRRARAGDAFDGRGVFRAPAPPAREKLLKLYNDGNYKEAFEGYRTLALDPNSDPAQVGGDLERATQCLRSLSRENEADDLVDQVTALHAKNWRVLASGAEIYARQLSHYGYIVAGVFERGDRREGGEFVNTFERDRVIALNLYQQAAPLVVSDKERSAISSFFMSYASTVKFDDGARGSWRLQYLTDLATCPILSPAGITAAKRRARRSTPRAIQPLQGTQNLRRGRQRRRTLALGDAASGRVLPAAAERSALAVRFFPTSRIRRANPAELRHSFALQRRRRRSDWPKTIRIRCTRSKMKKRSPAWPPG